MRSEALSIAIMLAFGGVAFAQRAPERAASATHGQVWTSEQAEWMPLPDIFPEGASIAVMNGDPARGAADFYLDFPPGYEVPWHFHTTRERIYMDKGALRVDMLDGSTTTLSEGGYASMPARMAHRATCVSDQDCLFYLSSSGTFDIYLIDVNGNVLQSWSAASQTRQ